jgi:GntR family transcriptional regulator
MPTPAEVSTLQLTAGTPVITVARVASTIDGMVVEVNDIIMAADQFELVYTIPAD